MAKRSSKRASSAKKYNSRQNVALDRRIDRRRSSLHSLARSTPLNLFAPIRRHTLVRTGRKQKTIPTVFMSADAVKRRANPIRALAKRECAARRKYKGSMMKAIAAQIKRSGNGHSLDAWRSKRSQNRKVGC